MHQLLISTKNAEPGAAPIAPGAWACQGTPGRRSDASRSAISDFGMRLGGPITVRGKLAGLVMMKMVLLGCEVVR